MVQLFGFIYGEDHYDFKFTYLDYLYTTSKAEADSLKPPPLSSGRGSPSSCTKGCRYWSSAPTMIYVWTDEAPGRVPLYRFHTGECHFYTLDENEGLRNGFKPEGPIAWVLSARSGNSKPYYRYRVEK